MAKNPDERYQTAQRLTDDLQAFLDDRPIQAKPPSILNRANKWSRRHRSVLVATAAVLMLLTIGSIASTVMLLWERHRTALAAAESKAVTDFLVNDLLAAAQDENKLNREITVSEVLEKAEKKVGTAFADQPLVEATLRYAIAKTYNAMGKEASGEEHARRALELRTANLGQTHIDTVEAMGELSWALKRLNRLDDAVVLCSTEFDNVQKTLGPDHPTTLRALLYLIKANWGDFGVDPPHTNRLRLLTRDYYERCRRVLGPEHPDSILARTYFASFCLQTDEEQLKEQQAALEVSERVLGDDDPTTTYIYSILAKHGSNEESIVALEKSLRDCRRIYGLKNRRTLIVNLSLARQYQVAQKLGDAKSRIDEGLAACVEMYGPNRLDTLRYLDAKCSLQIAMGKLDEARATREEWIQSSHAIGGPRSQMWPEYTLSYAVSCRDAGRLKEAQVSAEEGLKVCLEEFGINDSRTWDFMQEKCIILRCGGWADIDESERIQNQMVQLSRTNLGPEHAATLTYMFDLAYVQWLARQYQKSLATHDDVIPKAERVMPTSQLLKNAKIARKEHAEQLTKPYVLTYSDVIELTRRGEAEKTRERLDETLAILPDEEWFVRGNLGWVLATSRLESVRDGKKALEQAKKAAELTEFKQAGIVDTLAAAYAANGDFESAIKWVEKAIEIGNAMQQTRFKKHLEFYRSRKPWIST